MELTEPMLSDPDVGLDDAATWESFPEKNFNDLQVVFRVMMTFLHLVASFRSVSLWCVFSLSFSLLCVVSFSYCLLFSGCFYFVLHMFVILLRFSFNFCEEFNAPCLLSRRITHFL
uniref:Uncharacterized protein n=1 Tax=Anopheles maculatus TaxID=74869 RepID=A0A182S869_9DIPT